MPAPFFDNIVIADTSCLIGLTNVGRLNILKDLCATVTITPEIAAEYDEPLPEWIRVVAITDEITFKRIHESLDLGESTAITLALETASSLLVLDEQRARRIIAKKMGLPVIGTLGIIGIAAQEGLAPDALTILKDLRAGNFRLPADAETIIAHAIP